MSENLINKAYDAEAFRKMGHQLVDQLADYIANITKGKNQAVMHWLKPDAQYNKWKDYHLENNDFSTFINDVIVGSNHLHHPKYMGHQVSAPIPLTALTAMATTLLNNGMAIYEMGPVSSALERWILEQFSDQFGFGRNGDGFLTSGGTMATLTALLAARQIKTEKDSWEYGNEDNLAIMVPSEAHYCVDRAVRIMGFGKAGIIKVPVSEDFQMRTDLLPEYLDHAQKHGKKVIAVTANACSTSTGIYDNLEEVGKFCQENNLWFHVDAAHGGGAIFSEKHKYRLSGIENADSVIIDLHKMLMSPALATVVLFKNGRHSYQTFNQKAQYLWDKQEDNEWFNYAKRTFECTKLMMSVKFYSIINEYGFEIFDQNVSILFDLANSFAQLIKSRQHFELVAEPMSNIVCFRLINDGTEEEHNQLNSRIRKSLLEDGEFYIVQTEINKKIYLRVTLMNPLTIEQHLIELIDKIERTAKTNNYWQ